MWSAQLDSAAGPTTFQISALVVGVALLLFDFVLLYLSAKESRERAKYINKTEKHIQGLEALAVLYTRAEYEQLILTQIKSATLFLSCFWYSLHAAERSQIYQDINTNLSEAKRRGCVVKVITAAEVNRIGPAYQLKELGVAVSFQEALLGDDLRFIIGDHRWAILGVPNHERMNGAGASREGVEIRGRKITALLLQYFESQLSESVAFDDFASTIVKRYLRNDTYSVEEVARDLGIPTTEVERLGTLKP